MAANVRVKSFSVFVKRAGKKSGCFVESFDNPKKAIAAAMARKDRTNTVYVKQLWYNPKSGYDGKVKVYECNEDGLWFEDRFAGELKKGFYD